MSVQVCRHVYFRSRHGGGEASQFLALWLWGALVHCVIVVIESSAQPASAARLAVRRVREDIWLSCKNYLLCRASRIRYIYGACDKTAAMLFCHLSAAHCTAGGGKSLVLYSPCIGCCLLSDGLNLPGYAGNCDSLTSHPARWPFDAVLSTVPAYPYALHKFQLM